MHVTPTEAYLGGAMAFVGGILLATASPWLTALVCASWAWFVHRELAAALRDNAHLRRQIAEMEHFAPSSPSDVAPPTLTEEA